MRGEVLGVERRRRWDDEVKLAIVSAVGIDGATVTQVAHRHDVTRQQIYAWRHELKRKGLWSPDAGALFPPPNIPPLVGAGALLLLFPPPPNKDPPVAGALPDPKTEFPVFPNSDIAMEL